ncbi:Ig-like domain-containing protein, partial [Nioella sp. MMSF_3534]|uniref:Ig-like domain-containing protein n=1 Tax=Nioella sp. MMSF_3534 TaxID=3046720 RepID=UPI00273E4939
YTLTDAAGNESDPSGILPITIDTGAPAAPAAPTSYADNVGAIIDPASTAATTDDSQPGINIGAGLTDTPTLYVDGVAVAATYDPVAGTLTPDAPLADGAHDFTYTLTDAAGNESDPSGILPITIDTGAVAGTLSFANLVDSGVAGDGITNDNTFDLSLTGQEAGATVAYEVSTDGGTNWVPTTAAQAGIADGSYQFRAQVTDAAGNTAPSNVISVTIDTGPPAELSLEGTAFGGQLINPVTVSGRTYYYWDRDNSGGSSGISDGSDPDLATHNELDALFNGGADTTNSSSTVIVTNSSGQIITLRLPELGDPSHVEGTTTSIGGYEADNNPGYTGLLDIWDELNIGFTTNGIPAGWPSAVFWSASSTGSEVHAALSLTTGATNSTNDAWSRFVALEVVEVATPVAIDMDGDGQVAYSTARFDVNGDGEIDETGWVAGNDGVLFWDREGDGQLHDSGQYIFGQDTGSDLAGLRQDFDSNQDGLFNAEDERFAEFGVWQDVDQDGMLDDGEMRLLSDLGIVEIDLYGDGVSSNPTDNVHVQGSSTATLADGSTIVIQDAAFLYIGTNEMVSASHDGDPVVSDNLGVLSDLIIDLDDEDDTGILDDFGNLIEAAQEESTDSPVKQLTDDFGNVISDVASNTAGVTDAQIDTLSDLYFDTLPMSVV